MNLADKLDSLREVALREIDELDDEILLSKDLDHLAQHIAAHHDLQVPRLHRAVIGIPRAARMSSPGEPGREHLMVVVPATRVEMWLLVEGFATLSRLAEGDDLDLAEAEINAAEQCLMVAYVAEHPVADEANRFFQQRQDAVEEQMARVKKQVEAYNEGLLPALTEALRAAKSRAKERRKFAESLTLPRLKVPWGRV